MFPPSKDMPNRPPNWRWERARWLNESGKYARKKLEDPYVLAAKRFQSRWNKCRNDAERMTLERQFPGIYWAYHIYKDVNNVTRYQIEARLLAGEKPERIAQRCFITSPDIVRWYERLFFNVSDAMDSLDYLCGVVVGRAIYHGVTDRDFDILWKLYAIASRGQPGVLDDLLTTVGNRQASAYYTDDVRYSINRKAAITARTIPVAFNQQTILEIHAKLKELDQVPAGSNTESVFNEHIRVMLNSFGDAFSRSLQAGSVDGAQELRYHEGAAEPRAAELLAQPFSVSGTDDVQGAKDGPENRQEDRGNAG